MHNFIKKNQKRLLAFFGVALMIVFVVPQFVFDRGRGQNDVIGHIGKEPIQVMEVRDAKEQWSVIRRYFPPQILGAVTLAAGEIEKDPALFVLYQKEAQSMGLRVPIERATELATLLARQYAMMGQPIPNPSSLVPAIRSLLLVQSLFDRVAESIKLSDPIVLREMATNAQRVKLDLVHWSTADFEKDVPAPTPEQLQKQFDEFKNFTAGLTTDRNPFGFGYMMPSTVKLLYVTISRDEIAQAVRKGKTEFQWEVDARVKYAQNPADFAATQPTAATQPASQPTTRATSGPVTKPFAEVREQIVQDLLKPLIDRKVDEIGASLTDRMKSDFDAHEKKAADAPGDFGTRQYLERIAADIEKRENIKVGISEINEPKDQKALAELKGIGTSLWNETPFPRYVMQYADPFQPPTVKKGDDVLSLDEPSRRLRDAAGNVYIFQIQEAQIAHAPANVDAVKEKVTNDARTRAAFDLAKAAATKAYEQATAGGLTAAAKALNKDLFSTPDFIDRQGNTPTGPAQVIPKVELPDASREKLATSAFELLAQATSDKPHPVKLIDLPAAGRIVVTELAEVERPWPAEQEDMLKYQVSQRLMMQRAERILADYFRADAVKKRLDYHGRDDQPVQTAAAK